MKSCGGWLVWLISVMWLPFRFIILQLKRLHNILATVSPESLGSLVFTKIIKRKTLTPLRISLV